MKTRPSEYLIMLAVLILVMLICFPAFANGTPQPTPVVQPSSSTASSGAKSSSQSSSAIDLSLMNSATGGAGGSVRAGDSYAFVSGSATPLPPGLCPKGDSSYVQVLWGLLTVASSSTRTEMECLDKVLGMLRDTVQKPVAVNYLAPPAVTASKPESNTEPARLQNDASPQTSGACLQKPDPTPAKKKHVRRPQKECGKS